MHINKMYVCRCCKRIVCGEQTNTNMQSLRSPRIHATFQNAGLGRRRATAACRVPRSSKRMPPVKAELSGVVDSLVTYGALSISIGAALYAIFYPWPRDGRRQSQQEVQLSAPDNFTWALMCGISCMPLFNSLAWVLGALQSDNPRPYYWAAALYTLPLLRNGLDQDWFSISLLLLGAAHMQALRVGATEPEVQDRLQQQLKPLSLVTTMVSAAGQTAQTVFGSSSSSSSSARLGAGDDSNTIQKALQLDKAGDNEDVLQKLELEDFDRRLQDRTSELSGAGGSSSSSSSQRQQKSKLEDSSW